MTVRRSASSLLLLALLAFAPSAGAGRSASPQAVQINATAAPWTTVGSRVGITGSVKPHVAGLQVTLQQHQDGVWHAVSTQTAHSNGTFTFTARAGEAGPAFFRVVPSTGSGYAGGSPKVVVRVLQWSYLGDIYARPAVGDLATETIVSEGVHFEHPVALDAGCYNAWGGDAWIDYPLGRRYELLTATVGLAGYTDPASTATYSVIGNGKILASGKLTVGGPMPKLKVSLDGIGKIRLRINVPDPTNAGGCSATYTQVVFANAQILGP